MKSANYAPVYAAALYPQLAELARRNGYALAVHGSLARDMDLVAIPWETFPDPSPPEMVVEQIVQSFSVKKIGDPSITRFGRQVWTLSVGFGECFIDLSFTPALSRF